ncbi:hypothetical protein FQN49_000326 [Arthroderma sp. PD_2]|nr:hypothetical protein FQN49_000326 [Arthroderma sp. PD_2]
MHSTIGITNSCALSYRVRRCALIPKGVNLTLEEEAMVIKRIGYRPIPPPGALTSNWFTRSAEVNKTNDKLCEIGEQEVVEGRIDVDAYQGGSIILLDQHTATSGFQENGALPLSGTFTCSLPSRLRKDSWSIDIPHMSEIKPLNTPNSTVGLSPSPCEEKGKESPPSLNLYERP